MDGLRWIVGRYVVLMWGGRNLLRILSSSVHAHRPDHCVHLIQFCQLKSARIYFARHVWLVVHCHCYVLSITSTGLALFLFDGQNSAPAIRNVKPGSKSFCADTDQGINQSTLISKLNFDFEYCVCEVSWFRHRTSKPVYIVLVSNALFCAERKLSS